MEEVQMAALVVSVVQQAAQLYETWKAAQATGDVDQLRAIEAKLAAQNDALMG